MATCVISGTNRGIGLEFCRQLQARGDDVVALCRHASGELESLGVRVVEGVDVTSDASMSRLAGRLEGLRVDCLVNNAGILIRDRLEDFDFEVLELQFRVNALGPLRLTRALLPNLGPGARVAIVTSLMGSISDNSSGGYYGYRMSKAAVNMAGVSLSRDLAARRIAVALLHPGMVATDMTAGRGIPASDAVRGLIARLDEMDMTETGRFRHAEGHPLPW